MRRATDPIQAGANGSNARQQHSNSPCLSHPRPHSSNNATSTTRPHSQGLEAEKTTRIRKREQKVMALTLYVDVGARFEDDQPHTAHTVPLLLAPPLCTPSHRNVGECGVINRECPASPIQIKLVTFGLLCLSPCNVSHPS